jgi:hypothetical protein
MQYAIPAMAVPKDTPEKCSLSLHAQAVWFREPMQQRLELGEGRGE